MKNKFEASLAWNYLCEVIFSWSTRTLILKRCWRRIQCLFPFQPLSIWICGSSEINKTCGFDTEDFSVFRYVLNMNLMISQNSLSQNQENVFFPQLMKSWPFRWWIGLIKWRSIKWLYLNYHSNYAWVFLLPVDITWWYKHLI